MKITQCSLFLMLCLATNTTTIDCSSNMQQNDAFAQQRVEPDNAVYNPLQAYENNQKIMNIINNNHSIIHELMPQDQFILTLCSGNNQAFASLMPKKKSWLSSLGLRQKVSPLADWSNTVINDATGDYPLHLATRIAAYHRQNALQAIDPNIRATAQAQHDAMIKIIEILIPYATINAQNIYGQTACHIACKGNDYATNHALCKAGADPMIQDNEQKIWMQYAHPSDPEYELYMQDFNAMVDGKELPQEQDVYESMRNKAKIKPTTPRTEKIKQNDDSLIIPDSQSGSTNNLLSDLHVNIKKKPIPYEATTSKVAADISFDYSNNVTIPRTESEDTLKTRDLTINSTNIENLYQSMPNQINKKSPPKPKDAPSQQQLQAQEAIHNAPPIAIMSEKIAINQYSTNANSVTQSNIRVESEHITY